MQLIVPNRPDEPAANAGSNLHVSGLFRSIDSQYLDELFSKHGRVSGALPSVKDRTDLD